MAVAVLWNDTGWKLAALAVAASMSLAGTAQAADAVLFPSDRADVAVSAPVHIWSGPYAGTFVGYNVRKFGDLGGASISGEGFSGGAYGGFNVQSGDLVYGLEADLGGSDFDASGTSNALAGRVTGDGNIFGSLRGRVGVAADPFLIFGTAGLAVADAELALQGASDSNTNVGYAVGAGIEAKVADGFTTRLEYRYSDYGSSDYDLGSATVSSGFDEHSVRAGVALKF